MVYQYDGERSFHPYLHQTLNVCSPYNKHKNDTQDPKFSTPHKYNSYENYLSTDARLTDVFLRPFSQE